MHTVQEDGGMQRKDLLNRRIAHVLMSVSRTVAPLMLLAAAIV